MRKAERSIGKRSGEMDALQEKQAAQAELVEHIVCIKGIVSKGRRKGNLYHLTAIEKDAQFSSMLFKTAEAAGCEVVDLTVEKA
jgi:hypothetical protein